jgi:hemolysin activation/secretion protein
LNFALNKRSSDRFINAVQLTPQTLTTVDFGWRRMKLSEGARNSFDVTLTLGTPWLGADIDHSESTAGVPRAQFAKLAGGWQRQAALDTFGTLVTDLRLQYSPQVLYGAEQMALGSYSTVRGFTESVAVGDSGLFVRNDLYLAPDTWSKALPPKLAEKLATKLQPHLFLDMGVVFDNARHTQEAAGGAGIGFSWYSERVTIGGLIGIPLFSKDGGAKHEPILQLRADLKTW